MATQLQLHTHTTLAQYLPHPPDTGEAELHMVVLKDTPTTPTLMQGIARRCPITLHILQKRCLYGLHIGNTLIGPLNMDMGMHPQWKSTGSIHILNKVS